MWLLGNLSCVQFIGAMPVSLPSNATHCLGMSLRRLDAAGLSVRQCQPDVFSLLFFLLHVPAGSSSRGRDVMVHILGYKPTELAHCFYSLLVAYFCLYGPFNYISFINSLNKAPISPSVLPVLFLPCRSIQLYLSTKVAFFVKR